MIFSCRLLGREFTPSEARSLRSHSYTRHSWQTRRDATGDSSPSSRLGMNYQMRGVLLLMRLLRLGDDLLLQVSRARVHSESKRGIYGRTATPGIRGRRVAMPPEIPRRLRGSELTINARRVAPDAPSST